MALLTDDVPRMLARDLGVHPRREALMGVSMGGYGALLAAESLPQRYCSIAVGGPAIFPSYADEASSVGDAFDGASDYAQHDVIAGAQRLAHIPVLIRAGAKDPFVPGVHAFAAHLPSANVKIISGCHDDNFWRLSAPTLLAFTGKHLTAA
jgi:pimeloyl-ACP methyl ester carboxylesterase